MKKQILIVTAAALAAAVVILSGTSAATAQQTPQYQVGGFPMTPHQMSVLQPSANITERQRLRDNPQWTVEACVSRSWSRQYVYGLQCSPLLIFGPVRMLT